jgi:hypothetical protein
LGDLSTAHLRPAEFQARVAAVRREFDALDQGVPVFNIKTLGLRIEDKLARERLVADLAAAFGILALIPAAVGLYGILVYAVSHGLTTKNTKRQKTQRITGDSVSFVLL